MNTEDLNSLFCSTLIKELILSNVREFCIAPGSRSTPLALAAGRHPLARIKVHIDERGLGYYALGLSKALNEPVVIIVTSGSALLNLMPALLEASDDRIPLILLTADRPPELRQTMANQTFDQVKLFSSFVRYEFDLPCPSHQLPLNFVKTTIAAALYQTKGPNKGPVHLNCQFRKPLVGHAEDHTNATTPLTTYVRAQKAVDPELIRPYLDSHFEQKKGIIFVARIHPSARNAIHQLSLKLKWPIFTDPLSSMRTNDFSSTVIEGYESLLGLEQPDIILQFGDRFVSTKGLEWVAKSEDYILVSPHSERADSAHAITLRFEADEEMFAKTLIDLLPDRFDTSWFQGWFDLSTFSKQAIDQALFQRPLITELSFIRLLSKFIDNYTDLFVANSMPIRYVNSVFYPDCGGDLIFANRGHSGIDGNIATAIGIAKGTNRPLIALLGDMTALHDLNSLLLLQEERLPIIFVIFNNGGGQIFSHLPHLSQEPSFEKLFLAPQQIQFSDIAKSFNIDYIEFDPDVYLNELIAKRKPILLEVKTKVEENMFHFQEINKIIEEKVSQLSKPLYV